MSVVKATLIFSIATYLDVILNPLMCFITDSFYRTKLGRKFGDSLYLQVFRLCFFIGMLGKDSPLPFFYTGVRLSLTSLTESMQVVEKRTFLRKQEM